VEVKHGEETKRIEVERKECPSCGFKLRKACGKAYWIEYYLNGRRKRERIGPNKEAAEQRLREALKLRTEERFIDKNPAARLTLGELCKWYLELPEVKAKDSYLRDKQLLAHVKRIIGESTKIKEVTPGRIESYQNQRLQEPFRIYPATDTEEEKQVESEKPLVEVRKVRPATINREITILKVALNRAVRHGKLQINPISNVKKLPENNIRTRLLDQKEFNGLLEKCPIHIKPIVMVGYYMGLRLSEIIDLSWPEVDLKKGFIRLTASRTKTDSARSIPIHPEVKVMLESLPRGLHTDRVFLFDGKPFNEFKRSWKTALKNAGITGFVFHDLRHCALNNLRKAGNDFFQIMALSGHKTMSVFKRYNLVTEDELAGVKWPSEVIKVEAQRKEG
jgi:integrase